mmetsp:Transcript_2915/g.6034  ORF Transcript_2915/g.6034 Transcript_2915/m.6034 type:complete len:227 (+) Transcript_2915:122-802(+)
MTHNNSYTAALLSLICFSNGLYVISGFKAMSSPSEFSGRYYAPSCQSSCVVSSVHMVSSVRTRKTLRLIGGNCIQLHLSSSGGDQNGGIRRPPPRRALKKRKNKRREKMDQLLRKTGFDSGEDDEFLEDLGYIETRPMRRVDAVEAGLDYWIDETDLEKERQRRIATKNRKSMEGEISKQKLREEVVAPYKQNWIGVFSVLMVVLSTIVTKFPETMQIPVIPIPDL